MRHTKNIHIRTRDSDSQQFWHVDIKLGGFGNDNGDGNENNVKKQKV